MIPITRVCNRKCPECAAREQLTWKNPALSTEVSLDELAWAGSTLGYIPCIDITGGEPTLHTRFSEIASRLHSLFHADRFTLMTNGAIANSPDRLKCLLNFNLVHVTHYTEAFAKFHGGRPNTHELHLIKSCLEGSATALGVQYYDRHIPYTDGPFINSCCIEAYTNTIAYHNRRLYGCCMSHYLKLPGKSIPLTPDWRDHLHELDTPCERCFMSQGIDRSYTELSS
jgi:organic radical activating enzyme